MTTIFPAVVSPSIVSPSIISHAVVSTAGEALIDCVEQADGSLLPCLGGAVYNMTRALAKQGVSTCYLNPLSADRFGQALRKQLVTDGCLLARPDAVAESTSLAMVNVDAAGKADYSFYRSGVADRAITADALISALQPMQGLRMVATGCLALAAEDQIHLLPWLAHCRSAGKIIAIDANLRPAVMRDLPAYRASVRAALSYADIIKVSDDDLDHLFESRAPQIISHIDRARALFTTTPAQWIALTLGAKGAYLFHRDGRAWLGQEQAPLLIVDTVGAGDCFLAGMLAAYLRAAAPESILREAIACASYCVERRGCSPGTALDIAEHVAKNSIQVSDGVRRPAR